MEEQIQRSMRIAKEVDVLRVIGTGVVSESVVEILSYLFRLSVSSKLYVFARDRFTHVLVLVLHPFAFYLYITASLYCIPRNFLAAFDCRER